jgi:HPt (histidine-containing phosphotransfer) domain-containing protein
MIELLAASDFERLSVLSHNLKGTARGYGFPELARLGAALEQSANQMDTGALRTQMTGLSNYLDRVLLTTRATSSRGGAAVQIRHSADGGVPKPHSLG